MNIGEPLRGSTDLRVAIVVSPDQPLGLLANTVATIGVGLAAEHPGLGGVVLTDAAGASIYCSADRPVPILQSDPAGLQTLLKRAQADEAITCVAFPVFARSLHEFSEYEEAFPARTLSEEDLAGVGICGPSKVIRSLTGAFKLLR